VAEKLCQCDCPATITVTSTEGGTSTTAELCPVAGPPARFARNVHVPRISNDKVNRFLPQPKTLKNPEPTPNVHAPPISNDDVNRFLPQPKTLKNPGTDSQREEEMIRACRAMSMAAAMSLTAAAISQTPGSPPAPYTRSVTQNGTNVTVTISPVDPAGAAAPGLQELENVLVRVKLTDASTGSPLPGALPAAWVDSHPTAGPITQQQCVGEVKRFAEGSTFSHSQLDLTSFYVVLLNSDATLTVVDPRFGYGDTRLLAMVTLDGPAEDWALTENAERILISVPVSGKLLAVDTASWKIVAEASGIPKAARVVLQPDEAYVWVAYSGQGQDSGVTAIDARNLRVVAHIRTGAGYHHIAFSEDSSLAFVSNPDDGTVSIVVAAVGLRDGKAERGYGHRAGAQPVADVLAQAARRHGSHAEHRA
jgi:hypothetical protein